jgi:hypothetical protein
MITTIKYWEDIKTFEQEYRDEGRVVPLELKNGF